MDILVLIIMITILGGLLIGCAISNTIDKRIETQNNKERQKRGFYTVRR